MCHSESLASFPFCTTVLSLLALQNRPRSFPGKPEQNSLSRSRLLCILAVLFFPVTADSPKGHSCPCPPQAVCGEWTARSKDTHIWDLITATVVGVSPHPTCFLYWTLRHFTPGPGFSFLPSSLCYPWARTCRMWNPKAGRSLSEPRCGPRGKPLSVTAHWGPRVHPVRPLPSPQRAGDAGASPGDAAAGGAGQPPRPEGATAAPAGPPERRPSRPPEHPARRQH